MANKPIGQQPTDSNQRLTFKKITDLSILSTDEIPNIEEMDTVVDVKFNDGSTKTMRLSLLDFWSFVQDKVEEIVEEMIDDALKPIDK